MEQEENNSLTPQLNEELNATAEFQGNKDDEEDVLLTAQRYLNIFHQIHIYHYIAFHSCLVYLYFLYR